MLCVIWACVGTVPHTSIINKYVLSSEVTQALVNPLESFELVELCEISALSPVSLMQSKANKK
jgi:hypothetical protein